MPPSIGAKATFGTAIVPITLTCGALFGLALGRVTMAPNGVTGAEPMKKRRSKVSGKRAEGQRPRPKPRGGPALNVASHSNSSVTDPQGEVARVTRDLNEALRRETATSEVLEVIRRSSGELEPVFEAILDKAITICEAKFGSLFRFDGKTLRPDAQVGAPSSLIEAQRRLGGPVRGSLLERVMKTKQVNSTVDAAADPFPGLAAKHAGARSIVGVPMLKDDTLIGAILVHRQEVRPFDKNQISLLTNFAAQAVIAIENARLLNELRERTDDLSQRTTELTEALEEQTATAEVLHVISNSSGDLKPVFASMLEKAVTICDAKFGNIYRWDGDAIELVAAHNTPQAFAEYRHRSPQRADAENSIYGHMKETTTAIHVIDAATDQRYTQKRHPVWVAGVDLGGVRTFLAVPMLKEDELVGSFTVYRQEVRPFTDKQIALVQNFAAQAVIAIENARLLNELRQRTDDLSKRTMDLTESLEQQTATAKVLEVISRSAFELKAVFEAVVESSVRLCGAERGVIYRFDGETLRIAASYNAPPQLVEWIEQHPFRPGTDSTSGRATARAALERRTIYIPDVDADPAYASGAIAIESGHTFLAVPILKGDTLLGVITIYHLDVRPFTDKQIGLVETFADQAAIAIENVRLLDELRQRTDDLTHSLEQQTATADVLGVISRSKFELEPILQSVVDTAARLCRAEQAVIFRLEGGLYQFASGHGVNPDYLDIERLNPIVPGQGTVVGRAAMNKRVVRIDDAWNDPLYEKKDDAKTGGVRSMIGVPLMREGEPIGVIALARGLSRSPIGKSS
jgi:GAF domain-containing protein